MKSRICGGTTRVEVLGALAPKSLILAIAAIDAGELELRLETESGKTDVGKRVLIIVHVDLAQNVGIKRNYVGPLAGSRNGSTHRIRVTLDGAACSG